MESRFQRIFLSIGFLLCTGLAQAQDTGTATSSEEDNALVEDIIGESLDRPAYREDKIDTENFEIGAFVGIMSIEDFGTNPVYGVQFAYHINEDIFIEANYGQSKANKSSFEKLSGDITLLSDSERDYKFYNFNVGWNFLPGEVFATKNSAFNSTLYLIGGVGNTDFAGDTFFTFNIGIGYRFFINDWFAWQIGFRDHIFQSDIFGKTETKHNLDLRTGVTFFF